MYKNHRTILTINTLEVDGDINDDTFKEINLKDQISLSINEPR